MNPICKEYGHDWSPTGLYVNGILCAPCRRKGCEAERSVRETISETGFPSSVHGIPLDIDDDPQGGVAKIIMRELGLNAQINALDLGPGSVVIDIGAHVGIWSIWLAKRYPGITVHAYEPIYQNVERLRRNIEANEVREVYAHALAVTGDGRQVSLPVDLSSNSGGTSIYGGGWNAEKTIETPSVTLKTVFGLAGFFGKGQYLDRISLLKLDCEGAEYDVFTQVDSDTLGRVDR